MLIGAALLAAGPLVLIGGGFAINPAGKAEGGSFLGVAFDKGALEGGGVPSLGGGGGPLVSLEGGGGASRSLGGGGGFLKGDDERLLSLEGGGGLPLTVGVEGVLFGIAGLGLLVVVADGGGGLAGRFTPLGVEADDCRDG